jgi:ankyrin repeat protein
MKYLRLFEDFDSYDPYELMIIPPNKKAGLIMKECGKSNPNLDLVRDLIVLGANLEWKDEENGDLTPLHVAAEFGSVEIARMLIDAGAKLNVQDTWGSKTPLHLAVHQGRAKIAQMLIDAGADKDVQDKWDHTALQWAVSNGEIEIAQMLIDVGANVNMQDEDGWTSLHWAVSNGNIEITKILIDAGARKDIKNKEGEIPYDLTTNQELKNMLKP